MKTLELILVAATVLLGLIQVVLKIIDILIKVRKLWPGRVEATVQTFRAYYQTTFLLIAEGAVGALCSCGAIIILGILISTVGSISGNDVLNQSDWVDYVFVSLAGIAGVIGSSLFALKIMKRSKFHSFVLSPILYGACMIGSVYTINDCFPLGILFLFVGFYSLNFSLNRIETDGGITVLSRVVSRIAGLYVRWP